MIFSKKIVNYIYVVILLLLSGNPIVTVSSYIREIYLFTAVVLFIYDTYKNKLVLQKKLLVYVMPFIFLSTCQLIILDVTYNSAIFLLLKIYIGYTILKNAGRDFMTDYSNVMCFIAFISIPLYLYNSIYGIIPGKPISDIGVSIGIYTQLFDKTSGFIGRNSGMFWEPGAFQGYLNIAISYTLLLHALPRRRMKLMILIVALLTTKSTTGYLVFFVISFYYLFALSKANLSKRFLFLSIFMIIASYVLFTSDFLHDKLYEEFASDTYGYKEGRIYDYIRFKSLIRDNFLFGLSDQVATLAYTGNGFLSFLLYYGIFGIMSYCFLLFYNYLQQTSVMITVYLTLVVLLSLQGEGFIYYPMYLALPLLNVDNRLNTYHNRIH